MCSRLLKNKVLIFLLSVVLLVTTDTLCVKGAGQDTGAQDAPEEIIIFAVSNHYGVATGANLKLLQYAIPKMAEHFLADQNCKREFCTLLVTGGNGGKTSYTLQTPGVHSLADVKEIFRTRNYDALCAWVNEMHSANCIKTPQVETTAEPDSEFIDPAVLLKESENSSTTTSYQKEYQQKDWWDGRLYKYLNEFIPKRDNEIRIRIFYFCELMLEKGFPYQNHKIFINFLEDKDRNIEFTYMSLPKEKKDTELSGPLHGKKGVHDVKFPFSQNKIDSHDIHCAAFDNWLLDPKNEIPALESVSEPVKLTIHLKAGEDTTQKIGLEELFHSAAKFFTINESEDTFVLLREDETIWKTDFSKTSTVELESIGGNGSGWKAEVLKSVGGGKRELRFTVDKNFAKDKNLPLSPVIFNMIAMNEHDKVTGRTHRQVKVVADFEIIPTPTPSPISTSRPILPLNSNDQWLNYIGFSLLGFVLGGIFGYFIRELKGKKGFKNNYPASSIVFIVLLAFFFRNGNFSDQNIVSNTLTSILLLCITGFADDALKELIKSIPAIMQHLIRVISSFIFVTYSGGIGAGDNGMLTMTFVLLMFTSLIGFYCFLFFMGESTNSLGTVSK